MIHEHECSRCEAPLTCCCPSPLQVDRMTGKPRIFECVSCMRLGENVVQDALTEIWESIKKETENVNR